MRGDLRRGPGLADGWLMTPGRPTRPPPAGRRTGPAAQARFCCLLSLISSQCGATTDGARGRPAATDVVSQRWQHGMLGSVSTVPCCRITVAAPPGERGGQHSCW
jgi:hypothetical protein